MKIIKQGVAPGMAIYHGQCVRCNTIIECYQQEILPVTILGQLTVPCPTSNCGNNIVVEPGEYQNPWVDPDLNRKEWQATPLQ